MNPLKLDISPLDLRDFAKSKGWFKIDLPEDIPLFILEHANHPHRQLVFPKSITAADYQDSVMISLEKLAFFEATSFESLYQQALSIREDVLRMRIAADSLKSHVLPLGFATQFITGTEKLLKSAACTVSNPRTHHPRLHSSIAQQLIEKSHFGQTEPGSFIIQVSCPLNALDEQPQLELGDLSAPFVRKVMLAIFQSIQQLSQAIENDSVENLVNQLKGELKPLISSNFCESLQMMRDETLDNSLDLSFDWSGLRPVNDPSLKRPLILAKDYFLRIDEIQRALRPHELQQPDIFIGSVESLLGDMNDTGQREGDVILAILPEDGESIRVKARLTAEQYSAALRAHETPHTFVRLKGKLRQGRQPRVLVDVTQFEVLSDTGN